MTEAVAAGDYPEDRAAENAIEAVRVSRDGETPPDMAVSAARRAVAHSGLAPTSIGLTLHVSTFHQGENVWTPANYVQRHVLGPQDALALQLDQGSNGGMAALEITAAYLSASPTCEGALITTAERWCLPAWDRWRTDAGVVYGDGATALVLGRGGGVARLLAAGSSSEPELEELCRDDRGFTAEPYGRGVPLDLRSRKKQFLAKYGSGPLSSTLTAAVSRNVKATMEDAEAAWDDIRWVILPNLGLETLEWEFLEPLGVPPEKTLWSWGKRVGHLGAGDQYAALEHLVHHLPYAGGDLVLLAGIGIGFNWSSAILEL
ncbi:ketoacyl-ACP synthase III family protein [Streptomyces sp. NPDC006356]